MKPNLLKVPIKFLDGFKDNYLPEYQTEGSSGMDLCSTVSASCEPMERVLIPCGIALELPIGYEAQIRPRSGLAYKKGISVLNTPGTIDADYRGEIKVLLINFGKEAFEIHPGDRIAQMVIAPVQRISWVLENELSSSKRGKQGFGHTGDSS